MKIKNYILLASLLFLLSACTSTGSIQMTKDIAKAQDNNASIKKRVSQKSEDRYALKYIKGVMTKRDFVGKRGLWLYRIEAVDTKNSKLKSAKFYSTQRYLYVGDLVYAVIEGDRLKEIYVVEQNYKKEISEKNKDSILKPKSRYVDTSKNTSLQKRTKNRKNKLIPVPSQENINLN